jgi:hypothetical protein
MIIHYKEENLNGFQEKYTSGNDQITELKNSRLGYFLIFYIKIFGQRVKIPEEYQ